jgi:hypothetical protein
VHPSAGRLELEWEWSILCGLLEVLVRSNLGMLFAAMVRGGFVRENTVVVA